MRILILLLIAVWGIAFCTFDLSHNAGSLAVGQAALSAAAFLAVLWRK